MQSAPPFFEKGGKKEREYRPDNNVLNYNTKEILTSGQYITKCANILYIDPLNLLGYTFLCEHDGTKQRAEVK